MMDILCEILIVALAIDAYVKNKNLEIMNGNLKKIYKKLEKK